MEELLEQPSFQQRQPAWLLSTEAHLIIRVLTAQLLDSTGDLVSHSEEWSWNANQVRLVLQQCCWELREKLLELLAQRWPEIPTVCGNPLVLPSGYLNDVDPQLF